MDEEINMDRGAPLQPPPAAFRRLPEHLVVRELTRNAHQSRSVVPVSSLSLEQINSIEAASDKPVIFKAKRVGDGYRITTGVVHEKVCTADFVAEVCYPVPIDLERPYSLDGGLGPFFHVDALERFGGDVDAILGDVVNMHCLDVVVGSIEGNSDQPMLRRRRAPFPHLHTFVSLSECVNACPAHKTQLVSIVFPDETPAVPEYRLQDDKGGHDWLSVLDVRVALEVAGVLPDDEDDDEGETMTFAQLLKSRGPKDGNHMCNAVREGDLLRRCRDAKGGSAPFVKRRWLQRMQLDLWTAICDGVAPSVPGAPVLMDTNARKSKKRTYPAGAHLTSVEMTLKKRLHDPGVTIPVIDRIVNTVYRAREYGPLLSNLHVMRLLDEGGGILSDAPGPNLFDIGALARSSYIAVRQKTPIHKGLAATYATYTDVLSQFVDPSLPEAGNAFKYDSDQYITSTYNSVANDGASRVVRLLNRTRTLFGGEKGAVEACTRFVENRGGLPDGISSELSEAATKYRRIYEQKGLHDFPGFDINKISKSRRAQRHRRILELFWEINRDLRLLRDEASARGWTVFKQTDDDGEDGRDEDVEGGLRLWSSGEFKPLPVNHLKDPFVQIDNDVVGRSMCKSDLSKSESFVPGYIETLFKLDGAGRSMKRGWGRSPLFRTDGTKLIELWYLPKEVKDQSSSSDPPNVTREVLKSTKPDSKDKKKTKGRAAKDGYSTDVPPSCRKVGDDPGDVNEHYVCEVFGDKDVDFHAHTRSHRQATIEDLTASRERRVRRVAREATTALSNVRQQTFDSSVFARYVDTRGQHAIALAAAYRCRKARSESFESKRRLVQRDDRFIIGVLDGRRTSDVLPAWRRVSPGDDTSKDPTSFLYWGEGNATKSAKLRRRIDTAFRWWVKGVWVDEWGTSKHDCITHEVLAHAYRRGVGKGGQAGWIKDRDVKFRKTEYSLESWHPCPAAPCLVENRGFRDEELSSWLAVDRDGNAAYAIRELIGVPLEQRPTCYRRGSNT